jgi:hypothetical protein
MDVDKIFAVNVQQTCKRVKNFSPVKYRPLKLSESLDFYRRPFLAFQFFILQPPPPPSDFFTPCFFLFTGRCKVAMAIVTQLEEIIHKFGC